MGGDGYALCLRAGAPLIDMEFVQFFPIGHLAPRLIGMDPIMWDPFRYKLGGRLLNNATWRSSPTVTACRRTASTSSPAISAPTPSSKRSRPAAARRTAALTSASSTSPADKLREAFGPVIDRLAANGIDLTKMPVEVAPIAHYHMGGVAADARDGNRNAWASWSPAKRSAAPTAPTAVRQCHHRSLVFGRQAGRSAAARAKTMRARRRMHRRRETLESHARATARRTRPTRAEMVQTLQAIMADDVGPLRTGRNA